MRSLPVPETLLKRHCDSIAPIFAKKRMQILQVGCGPDTAGWRMALQGVCVHLKQHILYSGVSCVFFRSAPVESVPRVAVQCLLTAWTRHSRQGHCCLASSPALPPKPIERKLLCLRVRAGP